MDKNLTNKENFLHHLKYMVKFGALTMSDISEDKSNFLDLSISLHCFLEEISKSFDIPYSILLKFIYLGDDKNGNQ